MQPEALPLLRSPGAPCGPNGRRLCITIVTLRHSENNQAACEAPSSERFSGWICTFSGLKIQSVFLLLVVVSASYESSGSINIPSHSTFFEYTLFFKVKQKYI